MDKTSRVSPKQAACPNCNALCCKIRARVAEKISNMADPFLASSHLLKTAANQLAKGTSYLSILIRLDTFHKNKSDLMQAETCIMSSSSKATEMPYIQQVCCSLFNNQCCVRFSRYMPYNGSTRYGSLQSRQ